MIYFLITLIVLLIAIIAILLVDRKRIKKRISTPNCQELAEVKRYEELYKESIKLNKALVVKLTETKEDLEFSQAILSGDLTSLM